VALPDDLKLRGDRIIAEMTRKKRENLGILKVAPRKIFQ
jgi:hypothetical protein